MEDIRQLSESPDYDRLENIMKKLTPKQRRFVELFDGSPLYLIAQRAGYKSQAAAHALMKNKDIQDAIAIVRQHHMMTAGIQPSGIIKYWSDVIQDFEEETRDRLKASELMAKYYMMLKPANINIDNREQTVQIILPETTPPENRAEVDRLKRALPETIDVDVASPMVSTQRGHETKQVLTQEDIKDKLDRMHLEQELEEIL